MKLFKAPDFESIVNGIVRAIIVDGNRPPKDAQTGDELVGYLTEELKAADWKSESTHQELASHLLANNLLSVGDVLEGEDL